MEKLKRLLLECELALKERQIDTALENCGSFLNFPLKG